MQTPRPRTGTIADYRRHPELLLDTTDRAQLIAAGVCVACRRAFTSSGPHCPQCLDLLGDADRKAFSGMKTESQRQGLL